MNLTRSKSVATLLLLFSIRVCSAELFTTQITGEKLKPKTIVISIDDAPYEKWQSSASEPPSWTSAEADYLASVERPDLNGNLVKGVPAVWFLVSCHFSSQPPADPRSIICMGKRDADEGNISKLVNMGFVVGNHTHSHLGASGISKEDYVRELSQTQFLLDKYQTDNWHLYRAPGLNFPDWAANTANNDPYLRKLNGPIGVDVGGGFWVDKKWMGGDWDCPDKGLSPEQCGDLYLRDVRSVTQVHGAIVLFHNYVIHGAYSMRLIRYFMENLDKDIQVVDIRTHPVFFHQKTNQTFLRHSAGGAR